MAIPAPTAIVVSHRSRRYRCRKKSAVINWARLSATSGRIVCLAVHVGLVPGMEIEGVEHNQSEHVFGIDADGYEEDEKRALQVFLICSKISIRIPDKIVGHNILGFDLPFLFQRCLVNNIRVRPFIDLSESHVCGVFGTMYHWWLGSKRFVSLDDIARALGIESSKTAEAEGSKVFEMYRADKLAEIREYNLNDVRVVACFGR